MRLFPTPEQTALADAVSRSFPARFPLSRLAADTVEGAGDLRALNALGVLGLACGQVDPALGVAEAALIHARLGEHLVAPDVVASEMAACIAADRGDAGLLAGIVQGQQGVALGAMTPEGLILFGVAAQAWVVVLDRGTVLLAALPEDGPPRADSDAPSPAIWGLPIGLLPPVTARHAATGHVADVAALLIAAHCAGLAGRALAMAVEHVKVRRQFDKTLDHFQAIKHHCANLAIAATSALDAVNFAAWELAEARPSASLSCHTAALHALQAAHRNAALNIQIHGGMGFSDEFHAHRLVRRAHVWEAFLGGREQLLDRVAQMVTGG